MVSILIIDDHPLVADGVSAMLKDNEDIQVTAAAKTGQAALALLQQTSFDIILLDISLPDMDGLLLCEQIRKTDKTTKIIGLTSANEIGIITQLLQKGGNGYLLKNMERAELLDAIWQVLSNKIYLSNAANEKLLEQYRNVNAAIEQTPLLTRREKEILQLLNEGLNGPQIAARLFLSPYTVETHRENLLQKFNASNSQLLLKLARQNKLLD